jgi:branched-chain amino acid aminotransferase
MSGRLVEPGEATTPLTGDAALRGISVFEGIMAYRRPGSTGYAVISFDRHVERLHRSAVLMKLPIARLDEDVADAVEALLAHETAEQVYLRPTVYLESGSYGHEEKSALFVSARAVARSDGRPFDCIVSTLRHVPPTAYPHEAKIGAMYALFRLSRIEAMQAGADEALLLASDGSVAESPGASVFAVKARVAYTPPVAVGILPSITRTTAAAILSGHLATPVVEATLSLRFLEEADELFLTGTLDEIRPVKSLNGRAIGGAGAPLTSRLRDAYLRACRLGTPTSPDGTRLFAQGPQLEPEGPA